MANSYRIRYTQRAALPRLAWCAAVEPATKTIHVTTGAAVECHDKFFVEGAWDGRFDEGGFAQAHWFLGSGARLEPDGVAFSTGSNTLESLFHARRGNRLLFSNSLAFLLAASPDHLDPRFPHYLSVLSSSRFGIHRYVRDIPTADGDRVAQFLYGSLKVGIDGSIAHVPRSEPPDFADFAEYKDFLVSGLSTVWDNARAGQRRQQYGLITTVSSGYDSAACASLAKDIGGQEALTFRQTADGRDDSGTPIARHLGLRTHELDRQAGLANSRAIVEFEACCGTDIQFAACEDVLRGKLCLTGYFGDTLWDRQLEPPWGPAGNAALIRTEFSGVSMREFRLRVGFIHVPLAMAGMCHDRSIWNITHSAEMAPWTLHTSYDRPIARRLAEEAGVPRALFGQDKKVVVTSFNPDQPLAGTQGLAEDYHAYVACHGGHPTRGKAVHNTVATAVRVARRGARFLDKRSLLPRSLRMATYAAPPLPVRFTCPITTKSYLVPWAVAELRSQYAAAISGAVEARYPRAS